MRTIWITAGLGLLTACAAPIETKPVTAPLGSAALPERHVGQTLTYLDDAGKEVDSTVETVSGQRVSWQSADGWTWTALSPLDFNSAITWKRPDGSEGQQEYTPDPGTLFPLAVGKTLTVSYQGVNAGKSYRGQQRCTVKEEAQIEVPAGAFDTFVIVCLTGGDLSHPYSTATYYYAPAIGAPVLQKIEEKGQSARTSKLVRPAST